MQIKPSQIGFVLFLLANATIYVRPWEIFPSIADIQLYLMLILAAFVIAHKQIQHHLEPACLRAQPITLCVIGLLFAVPISHITNGYLGGAIEGSVMMFKTVIYFIVLVSLIDSVRRFRIFLVSLAFCGLTCITISVADYHEFLNIESLTHIKERLGYTAGGQGIFLIRLCGLGMFHDPNDMSLLIITTAFLSLAVMRDRELGQLRYLWIFAFPILALAIHDTHSRGGLIAAGAATMAFLTLKYGRKVAMTMIGMGALAAPVLLGRMGNIDLSGGTGQQRIRLWAEGFAAIQGPKAFFGIGQGMYEGLANYVAHNSYVHSFVEMGVFGGTFFMGVFFFTAYGMYRIKREHLQIHDAGLVHYQPYVAAVVAAWAAGFLSLSRVYPPPTYTIFGIAAAFMNLSGIYMSPVQPVLRLDMYLTKRWVASSALLFVALFLATKFLAHF